MHRSLIAIGLPVSESEAENHFHPTAAVKTDTLHELVWAEVVKPYFSTTLPAQETIGGLIYTPCSVPVLMIFVWPFTDSLKK